MRYFTSLSALALFALAACGGSDAEPQPEPPAPPGGPRFTSLLAFNIAENAAAGRAIYQATASDPNNDALTFSISGGADASRFQITPAGALSFIASPDFEAPTDANGDNFYSVQLRVSDGQLTDTIDIVVTVTNVVGDSVSVRRIASGLNQPLFVAPVPGEARVFVLEKGGRVLLLDPATGATTVFLEIPRAALSLGPTGLSTDGERGLLGLATAPDYATSGQFYVYLTNAVGNIEIRRYRRVTPDQADPRSGEVVLTIPHREYSNHNGGWLGFGPDGRLYVATGDGGGAGDPLNNAQNPQSLLGKVLRLAINADPYACATICYVSVPPDNPDPRSYVIASGLRNPFRASFDGPNLLIGDVGQGAREEINLLRPQDHGANFGWPILEGTQPYRGGGIVGLTPPVAEYEHGSGPNQGRSITGGYVYRGPGLPLQGQYLFGDFVTPNLWTLPAGDFAQGTTLPSSRFARRNDDLRPDAGAYTNIVSFGEDAARNVYFVDFDGEIFMLRAS